MENEEKVEWYRQERVLVEIESRKLAAERRKIGRSA